MNQPRLNESSACVPEIISAVYPPSPPLEKCLDAFWKTGPEFDTIQIRLAPPETPLELLESLGPSPFERGGFPLIGFLATTYDKVTQYALERGSARSI